MSNLKKISTDFLIVVLAILATSCVGAFNKDYGSFGFDNPIKFSKEGGTRHLEHDGPWYGSLCHVNFGGGLSNDNYFPRPIDEENPSEERIVADWLIVESGKTYIRFIAAENLSGKPRVADVMLIALGGYGHICVMQD